MRRKSAPIQDRPVDFVEVYREELRWLNVQRAPASETTGAADSSVTESKTKAPDPDKRRDELAELRNGAWQANLAGLALSGGGIRSATFNLGVIQALSELNILNRFHYLSTVSGGGYIGGWLTALLHRARRQGPEQNQAEADLSFSAIEQVEKQIGTVAAKEDPRVRHLRRFSNYLAPRIGALSADTWALIATYVRNLFLNQSILIGALLMMFFFIWGGEWIVATVRETPGGVLYAFVGTLCASLLGAISLGYNLASVDDQDPAVPNGGDDGNVFLWVIVPPLLSSIAACVWLPHLAGDFDTYAHQLKMPELAGLPGPEWLKYSALAAIFNAVLWAVVWLVGRFSETLFEKQKRRHGPQPNDTGVPDACDRPERAPFALIWVTAVLAAALLGPLLAVIGGRFFEPSTGTVGSHLATYVFVPPMLLAWLVLVATLHVGLLGRALSTFHREWLSRLGAWLLISAVSWVFLAGITVGAYLLMARLPGWFGEAGLTAGWLGTTVMGLLAGRGATATPGRARRLLMAVAPYVFVLGLLILIATLATRVFVLPAHFNVNDLAPSAQLAAFELQVRAIDPAVKALWAAVLATLLFVLAWRVDVNEFSLRNMYKNRLVRAYLGASHSDRYPQPFTGFGVHDDLQLGELCQDETASGKHCLYPLINTAVNLSRTDNLDWQERKAGGFLLSPRYCGFEAPGNVEVSRKLAKSSAGSGRTTARNYAPTDMGRDCGRAQITLGDAMATSGAAANPNMGFRTTGAFAFLLSAFNVRLGRWVGNPRRIKRWREGAPWFALIYLLKEALNRTGDGDRFLQLSDGGHFDNLGLYTLVKRRCRYILCCDVGADGDYEFEDLGNAIRKCRVDFGVQIDIDVSAYRQLQGEDGNRNAKCAVGRIVYPETDDERQGNDKSGILIYIKATKLSDIPTDVLNYALEEPGFPHQSTGDQFFSETQFESYRKLGRHIASLVLSDDAKRSDNIGSHFRDVRKRLYPSDPNAVDEFVDLGNKLDALFERLGAEPKLEPLHRHFYPEWQALLNEKPLRQAELFGLPTDPDTFKACFYFCSSLLQLMENCYLDLNLEAKYGHPDNRGWMNLFRQWAWSPIMRATWAVSAATYGARFQNFCQDRLGMTMSAVSVKGFDFDAVLKLQRYHLGSVEVENRSELVPLNVIEVEQLLSLQKTMQAAADRPGSQALKLSGYFFRLEVNANPPIGADDASSSGVGSGSLPEGWTTTDRHIPFGYALVRHVIKEQDKQPIKVQELLLFRIQDHLRNMGFGASALTELVKSVPDLALADRRSVKACMAALAKNAEQPLSEKAKQKAIVRFEDMYRLAQEEINTTMPGG